MRILVPVHILLPSEQLRIAEANAAALFHGRDSDVKIIDGEGKTHSVHLFCLRRSLKLQRCFRSNSDRALLPSGISVLTSSIGRGTDPGSSSSSTSTAFREAVTGVYTIENESTRNVQALLYYLYTMDLRATLSFGSRVGRCDEERASLDLYLLLHLARLGDEYIIEGPGGKKMHEECLDLFRDLLVRQWRRPIAWGGEHAPSGYFEAQVTDFASPTVCSPCGSKGCHRAAAVTINMGEVCRVAIDGKWNDGRFKGAIAGCIQLNHSLFEKSDGVEEIMKDYNAGKLKSDQVADSW